MMYEVEDSEEYDSESSDLQQDRLTQGTLTGGSPIRQARAKSYSQGAKIGMIKEWTMVVSPEEE